MADEPQNSSNSPTKPYNEMAFEEFLKAIGNGNIKNWSILAEALGVDRKTIWAWKQHPLAQNAINTAISEAMQEMVRSGKEDWRMHRELLKIFGVKDKTTLEHEVGEGVEELLDKLDRTDYDKLGREAKKQVLAANPPIQNKE